MAVVLNTQITLDPNNQIAHLADFTDLEVGTEYVITADFIPSNTFFTFLGYFDITLTRPPVGVPQSQTEVPATISTMPVPAVATPPAAYPYALNDRLTAAGLNHAFQLNSGTAPPVGNGGNAHQYAEWIDTSVNPATLRMCTVPVASNGYIASEWVKIASVDVINNTYLIDQSAITIVTPPPGDNDTSIATTAYVQNALTGYLRLTGGTLSGQLNINASLWANGPYIYLAGSGGTGAVNGTGGPLIYSDVSNTVLKIGSGNGNFIVQNYAGTNILLSAANGDLSAAHDAYFAGSQVHISSNGIEYFGNLHQIGFTWDGTVEVYVDRALQGHIALVDGAGNLSIGGGTLLAAQLQVGGLQLYNNGGYLYTPSSFRAPSILSDGNLNVSGTGVFAQSITVGGITIQNNSGWLYSPSAILSNGTIQANGDLKAIGWVLAQNIDCTNDVAAHSVFRRSSLAFGGPKGARMECYGGDWDSASWAVSSGTLYVSPDSGANGTYYINSGGFSDARLKTGIRDAEVDALAAICAVPVRSFEWNDEGMMIMPYAKPAVECGIVAQELEKIMPDAVGVAALAGEMRYVNDSHLTPYIFRAIQQLYEEIEALKEKMELSVKVKS